MGTPGKYNLCNVKRFMSEEVKIWLSSSLNRKGSPRPPPFSSLPRFLTWPHRLSRLWFIRGSEYENSRPYGFIGDCKDFGFRCLKWMLGHSSRFKLRDLGKCIGDTEIFQRHLKRRHNCRSFLILHPFILMALFTRTSLGQDAMTKVDGMPF